MDIRADTGADDAADGQWMTYAELGAARGISKESALKLALRRKWRKQDDNRGHVRVYVPLEDIPSKDKRADVGAELGADMSRISNALEGAVSAFREASQDAQAQITDAKAATEAAERRAEAATERADAMARELAIVREKLSTTAADLDRFRATAAAASAAALRADEADGRAKAADFRAERERLDRIAAERKLEEMRSDQEWERLVEAEPTELEKELLDAEPDPEPVKGWRAWFSGRRKG